MEDVAGTVQQLWAIDVETTIAFICIVNYIVIIERL